MRKKRILLSTILLSIFLSVFVLFLLTGSPAFAADNEERCCITEQDGCKVMFDGDEALCRAQNGEFFNGPCSDESKTTQCSIGCCSTLGGGLRRGQYKITCDRQGGQLINTRAFEASVPADICGGLLECQQDAQCPANTHCVNTICIPGARVDVPRCENTIQDAGESDVDCGGACPPCAQDKLCSADRDCRAGLKCDADTHRCVPHITNCRNGVVDPGEDCDFEPGSNRVLFKQGVTSCQDLDKEPGKKYTGGTLACNSFCRLDVDACTFIPLDERRTAPSGACGDGTLDTPNEQLVVETCEIGEHASRCTPGTTCGCTNAEQCQPTDCVCRPACTAASPGISVFEARQTSAHLEWTIAEQQRCPIVNQHVLSCEKKEGSNCPTLPFDRWQRSADLVPERRTADRETGDKKNLCFAIEVNYEDQPAQISDSLCLDECTEGERFCDATDVEKRKTKICRTGIIQQGEPCGADQYCTEPSRGTIECRAPDLCAKCNGVFQVFAGVLFDKAGLVAQQACEQLTGCIYDKSEKTVNVFRDCANVASCYDYRTKYACENDEAHCKITAGGCAWQPTNPELGQGVCRPADEEKQQCDVCTTRGAAGEIGTCTRETCELFGEGCYFSEEINQCKSKEALGCNDYNGDKPQRARQECIGGRRGLGGERAVAIDTVYDGNQRRSGTNRITQRSNDRFQFGLCKYAASGPGERCFKDADGNGVDDCSIRPGGISEEECNRDFTPPETSLVLDTLKQDQNNRLKIGKILDIPIRVSESATTYFCLDHNCYPKNYTMCRIQKVLTQGDASATRLNFYSQDRASNLEERKHRDIAVNINPPRTVRERAVSISPDSPRELLVDLEYTDDVVCNGKLTNIKGDEMRADDTPQAQLQSNAMVNEHGRKFQREYHNLKDDVYVFTYDCKDAFGNVDHGQDVQIIDTNKIHISSATFGGSDPVTSATRAITVVRTDEPATCYLKSMGTNRQFSPFSTADAEPMQPDAERKEHNKNVELKDDLNIFQVACQFEGQQELEGNRADRIIVSKDIFPPTIEFFGSIDRSIRLEPGSYGTAQNVFLYCSDARIRDQYGLDGLDAGCGDVSAVVNGAIVRHAFSAESNENGFVPPLTPIVVGNALQGGSSTLEIVNLRAADKNNHETVLFEREPFRINVADRGDGQIENAATVALADELGADIPLTTPPNLPKGVYRITINTGRVAQLDNLHATITAIGMVEQDDGQIVSEGEKTVGELTAAHCRLKTPSTIECVVDAHQLSLEDSGAEEKDLYQLRFAFNAVNVIEKGTECFAGEQPTVALSMRVPDVTIILNTKTPELRLEPIFSSVFFDADEDWEAFAHRNNYSIYYYPEEGLAYTNQRELFVTGVMDHPEVTEKIEYYTAACDGVLAKQKEFRPGERIGSVLVTTSVNLPEHITNRLTINTLPGADLVGKFFQFASAADARGRIIKEYAQNRYGAFSHYYRIDRVDAGTPSTLHLDAPIEEVPVRVEGNPGIPITIFTQGAEPEIFGEPVSLREGCNLFAAKGVGNAGGAGSDVIVSAPQPDPSALAGIIVDTEGPRVIANIPAEGTTNQNITNVSIVVEENVGEGREAALLPETVTVTIIPATTGGSGATEEAEGEGAPIIDGEGCENNLCRSIQSSGTYSYNVVTDRLVDENNGAFVEGNEKNQILAVIGWNALHDEYVAAVAGTGEGAGSGEIIVGRLGERNAQNAQMIMRTEENAGKRRYTITYRNGELFEGGQLVLFEGRDKAGNRLVASETGKPSWAFNVDEGTPKQPTWEFLTPAVKQGDAYYARTNVNVRIDYSSTPEPVTIGEPNPDGTINGRLFAKRFDAPLGQEDPLPAVCERTQHNVFVCNTRDFALEQFNRAYTLVVEARKKLANNVEGPPARHVSPVLVMDNQPPQIVSYEYPAAVAYNGKLRITMEVRDSGFDLRGRALFDVTGRQDLHREPVLVQAEHQPGTNRYVFEWDLGDERFSLNDEDVLSRENSFTIFIDDYAGNVPSAVLVRTLRLDFRGPDEERWKVNIQTPFSIPEEQKYFTKEATVKINGSFSDDDICATCIFITPGNYLPATDSYDTQQIATVLALPEKRFTTTLRLKAREQQIINQTYMITIKDIAGFAKTRQFTIFADRRPPEQVSVNII